MAPGASAVEEQGFSEAVTARIEAPQWGSTRSVYEAKWTFCYKWCITNQVSLRAPPVKSVADFLMYLMYSTRDRPAGGDTGRLFLTFGGPVCADRISYCPLDRVLTYKNLIFLLNLQDCSCCNRQHNGDLVHKQGGSVV